MTVEEVAGLLKISAITIKRRIRAGEISASLVPGPTGDQYEITEAEVTRLLRPVAPDTPRLPHYLVRPWA